MEETNCPHIDVKVEPQTLEKDFLAVLAHIRLKWVKEDVLYEKFDVGASKGLLNTMVKCFNKNDAQDAIMIRVYNSNMNGWMDRSIEIKCIKHLQPLGCAPKILATFNTGFCYKFIPGEILNYKRMREEAIWKQTADILARFHSIHIEEQENFKKDGKIVQVMLDKMWNDYPDKLPDPKKNELFKRFLPPKAELKAEVDSIYQHCKNLGSPILLCHNDTKAENMIWNAETGKLSFVDFEAMNYVDQALEIATHFQRYCGLAPPDYNLMPSEEFQLKWLRFYLEKLYQYTGKKASDVTDKDVQRLYIQVVKYHLLQLIISGLGGPVFDALCIGNNEISFLDFALVSVKEYNREKKRILSLKMPD